MAEEMVNRFSKFQLLEKEDEGIQLNKVDIAQSAEECNRSLLGKVWGKKAANFTGLKSTLNQLWCQNGDLKVIELGFNYYQFVFSDSGEKERVLARKPWYFDNQIIVLHKWQPKMRSDDPSFSLSQMWVQVKGLPSRWSSKEVGWKLGKLFSTCLNVIYMENGSRDGKILKILVEVNLGQPLLRGTKIKMDSEVEWAEFKYE